MKLLPPLAAVLIASAAVAQPSPQSLPAPGPQSYGTIATTVVTKGFSQFLPRLSTTEYSEAGAGGFYRYVASGSFKHLLTGVDLPQGALVTAIEVEGCNAGAGDVHFYMQACAGITCGPVVGDITLPPGTPCGVARLDLEVPHQVDNSLPYHFGWSPSETGVAQKIALARVYYKLQVSPAPETATFEDVPTSSPYHRFVEALAAAGITSGCGGGKFCPDAPLTRAQMAVFLSAALGLHFPN